MLKLLKETFIVLIGGLIASLALGYFFSYKAGKLLGLLLCTRFYFSE